MNYEISRRHMVNSQVRPNDVTDLRLLQAMETTPREIFVPAELRDQVYAEREIAYAPGRRLLRARDFAKLITIADVRAGDLVLNASCGTGYSTAILAHLAEMVVSLEADEALAAKAQENFDILNISNAAVIAGEPSKGAPDQGPFDVIFLGVVIERQPDQLLSQLRDGGKLATIWREDGVSRAGTFTRAGDVYSFTPRFDAAATTVSADFAREEAFVF